MTLVEILEFLRECFVIDVAAILGVIISIVSLIVNCIQKRKLHDAEASLKKELQEANHKQEEKILHLTKLYENIPYFAEQKEKKIDIIKNYKDIVSNILRGEYDIDRFNSIADDLLTCLDEVLDAKLISEIKALNEKIKEYFERIVRNDSWANVTLGQVKDLFEALKPNLLTLIRDQKSTIEHTTKFLYAAHDGEKVEEANMSSEQVENLKIKVKSRTKKAKPPRKRGG